MDMTAELKAKIDKLDYFSLLEEWRYAPAGTPIFQGESGNYWRERMEYLRSLPGGIENAVAASKWLSK